MEQKLKEMTNSIALLVGLVLGGVYFMTMYDGGESRESQISNINSQIMGSQSELDKMNQTIVEAEKFKDIARQLGSELDVVITAIPENYNTTELMKVLSTESKTVGLSILSLNAQSSSRGQGAPEVFYEPVGVRVGLEGTFNQLMKFVSNLTKVNRIIIVKDLVMSIQGNDLKTASPIISFSASFEGYRYLPPKPGEPGA